MSPTQRLGWTLLDAMISAEKEGELRELMMVERRYARGFVCFVVIGTLLFATGCASMMLPSKVDPKRSYEASSEGAVSVIGIDEHSRTVVMSTGGEACRFGAGTDWRSLKATVNEDRKPSSLVLRRDGLRACSAELHFPAVADENDGMASTQEELVFYLRGARIKDVDTEALAAQLTSAQGQSVQIYFERKSSMTKRYGYRSLALIAGIGIDYAIISSSWASGTKVFADLWAGYAIGCWGVSGNSFC